MPQVRVSIQHLNDSIAVVFMDAKNTHRQLGRIRRYSSEEPILEMLRRARADLETRNIVEMTLRERRVCNITLNLTDEQYAKLTAFRS